MRNIDSTFDPRTNERFVTAELWIRKLRIISRFRVFQQPARAIYRSPFDLVTTDES